MSSLASKMIWTGKKLCMFFFKLAVLLDDDGWRRSCDHLWAGTSLQNVQPVHHIGQITLQPQQSCRNLLIHVCSGSAAALWHPAGGIGPGTLPRTAGRPRQRRSWKEGFMLSGNSVNNSGLLRLTSSSAGQGAVKLALVNPVFKEGICHHGLIVSRSSSTSVEPKILLPDGVGSWSRTHHFWCSHPLRNKSCCD